MDIIVGSDGFQKIVGQNINVPHFLVLGTVHGHHFLEILIVSVDDFHHFSQKLNHAQLVEDTLFFLIGIVTTLGYFSILTVVNEPDQVFEYVDDIVKNCYIDVIFKLFFQLILVCHSLVRTLFQ